MSDARAQAQAALDELVGQGLLVAGLVGRDGLPILLRFSKPVQEETFSAMSAALLGAAEAALLELAETGSASATIEAGAVRLVVAGLDDVHLLVLAAPASLPAAKLAAATASGRAKLAKLVGG